MRYFILVLHWTPAIAWALVIFYLSSETSPPGTGLMPDFAAHFIAYAILGITLVRAQTRGWKRVLPGRGALLLWLLACAYALSDEYHQFFVPGRNPSIQDLLFDFSGAGVVIWFLSRWKALRSS